MNNSISLIFLAIVFGVGGQLTLKMGMTNVGRIDAAALAQPLQMVMRILTSPLVIGGLGLYVLGAVAWLAVLSRVPLSFAYPILGLSYAITPALAWLLLGETLPIFRLVGIGTICLGVFLVSRS